MFQILICILFLTISVTLATDSSISFVAIGDWGGKETWPYYTEAQKEIASSMNTVAKQIDSKFVVALGDNFYHEGVDNVDSKRFAQTWENVYTGLNLQTDWYVLGGNHDHYGNVTAQVEFTKQSSRWKYPSLYHSHSFSSSNQDVTVDVILIDTVDLAGYHHVPEDHPNYFNKLPPRARNLADSQWSWIETKMASSKADYLLVMGHYPVYSVCEHGNTDTLISELLPLLETYGAHYLSGHDHCMEYIKDSTSSVHHYLIGMGVECCYKNSNFNEVPSGSVKWYMAANNRKSTTGGFASFTMTKTSLTATFYDQSGGILFSAPEVPPRQLRRIN